MRHPAFALLAAALLPLAAHAQSASQAPSPPRSAFSIAFAQRPGTHDLELIFERQLARRFAAGLHADVNTGGQAKTNESTRPTGVDRLELGVRYTLVGSPFEGLSLGLQAGEQRVLVAPTNRTEWRLSHAATLGYDGRFGPDRRFSWSTAIVARNSLLDAGPARTEWSSGRILALRFGLGIRF